VYLPQVSEQDSYIKTITIISASSRENQTQFEQHG